MLRMSCRRRRHPPASRHRRASRQYSWLVGLFIATPQRAALRGRRNHTLRVWPRVAPRQAAMRATALLRTAVLVLAAAVAGKRPGSVHHLQRARHLAAPSGAAQLHCGLTPSPTMFPSPFTFPCAGAGSLPAWYRCTCPPAGAGAGAAPCVCPSTAAPGGLAPADTPQFVLFTVHMGAVGKVYGVEWTCSRPFSAGASARLARPAYPRASTPSTACNCNQRLVNARPTTACNHHACSMMTPSHPRQMPLSTRSWMGSAAPTAAQQRPRSSPLPITPVGGCWRRRDARGGPSRVLAEGLTSAARCCVSRRRRIARRLLSVHPTTRPSTRPPAHPPTHPSPGFRP